MPIYVPYNDGIETVALDEVETHGKIVAALRRLENKRPRTEPASIDEVPA